PKYTGETAPRRYAEIIAADWFLSEPEITEQDSQSKYGTGTQGFRIIGAFPRFAGISGDRYETPEAIILVVTKTYPSKIVFYDVEVASGSGETEPEGL
ncbi:MAG: hypothetical protein HY675_23540, partial [Chloroflexi bacterium]|nr:hypothetical protein [Chloroflexota bacterium]